MPGTFAALGATSEPPWLARGLPANPADFPNRPRKSAPASHFPGARMRFHTLSPTTGQQADKQFLNERHERSA